MKDKSKLTAIILVIITILVVVISAILKKEEKTDEFKINIVTNYSNFYTVNSCLYRTITYITSNDRESLLLILDDKYEKENNINENNILDIFGDIKENSTFVSEKMYYQKINDNIMKYYVYGYIEENAIADDEFTIESQKDYRYFIVYLDTNNKTFSIEPYSGEVFIGGDKNEK